MKILTIGHSTHPIEHFLSLLTRHAVEVLVDIRRLPGSRKFPQFNQDDLAAALGKVGISYYWLETLGGRRGKQRDGPPSPNLGLRNLSFRNYADYMLTREFEKGIARLRAIARRKRIALMCAETLFWRCHRRLVSDYLTAKGTLVEHIMANGSLRPHTMTPGAQVSGGKLTYPAGLSTDRTS